MTPQKKKAILFLLLMILVSCGIIVWHFFINFGTAAISEKPEGGSFFTTIGAARNVRCNESPCHIKIKPGTYQLLAKKEGYADNAQSVEVQRWKEVEVLLSFEFIPVVKNLGTYVAEKNLARWENNGKDFGPVFDWSEIDLSKIPHGAKKVLFSPTGRKAAVFLGKEFYFFNHPAGEEASLTQLSLQAFENLAWTREENLLLLTAEKEAGGGQDLLIVDPLKTEKAKKISSFERALQNPQIFVGTKKIIVAETLPSKENRLYEISFEKKTKRRLDISGARNFRLLSDDLFIYKTDTIYAADAAGNKIPIDALSPELVLTIDEARFLFVSDAPVHADGNSNVTDVTFEEFAAMTKENIEAVRGKKTDDKKWHFVAADFGKGLSNAVFKDMAAFSHEEGASLATFLAQKNSSVVYFVEKKGGEENLLVLELDK